MKLKYIFGPVLSRRLGISLGIDLIPFKTCSLDCIYCECGKTTDLTMERKEYTPTAEVISELNGYLSKKPPLDYITFSGSGEPTLHKDLGIIINFLKDNYPEYKIALLTNSLSFAYHPEILEEINKVDLIVPSLDAGSEDVFKKICRPIKGITIEKVKKGLIELSKMKNGQIWLEIFIIPGINDAEQELLYFKDFIGKMKADKVQLNHLDRPGSVNWVKEVSFERLKEIADFLNGDIEIV